MIQSGSDDNSLLADLSVECRSCMSTFEPLGDTQINVGFDQRKQNKILRP